MDHTTNHVLGCLLGLASGDAFGMPTEFLTRDAIKSHYGCVDRFLVPHAGHFHEGMPAGRITDDTGQSLAILKGIVRNNGRLDVRVIADAMIEWKRELGLEFNRVVGPSTRKALEELERGDDPEVTGREGRTNGAAMRAPIAGLLHAGNLQAALDAAYLTSLPTHGTSLAIAGAGAVACAVSQAMVPGSDLESILLAAQTGARLGAQRGQSIWGTSLEKRIGLAFQMVEEASTTEVALENLYHYIGVDMVVAESVACAFGIVKLAKGDPVQAVTLSANIGGDTDTIGAIAGAVCGAWKGAAVFPSEWLDLLEQVNQFDLVVQANSLSEVIENHEAKIQKEKR